jgi:hypothetical protein
MWSTAQVDSFDDFDISCKLSDQIEHFHLTDPVICNFPGQSLSAGSLYSKSVNTSYPLRLPRREYSGKELGPRHAGCLLPNGILPSTSAGPAIFLRRFFPVFPLPLATAS